MIGGEAVQAGLYPAPRNRCEPEDRSSHRAAACGAIQLAAAHDHPVLRTAAVFTAVKCINHLLAPRPDAFGRRNHREYGAATGAIGPGSTAGGRPVHKAILKPGQVALRIAAVGAPLEVVKNSLRPGAAGHRGWSQLKNRAVARAAAGGGCAVQHAAGAECKPALRIGAVGAAQKTMDRTLRPRGTGC